MPSKIIIPTINTLPFLLLLLLCPLQANFFVPLAEKYPEQAMSRFESGQFPISAASKMAYVKAASALGRMDQIDIQASVTMNKTPLGIFWLGAAICVGATLAMTVVSLVLSEVGDEMESVVLFVMTAEYTGVVRPAIIRPSIHPSISRS